MSNLLQGIPGESGVPNISSRWVGVPWRVTGIRNRRIICTLLDLWQPRATKVCRFFANVFHRNRKSFASFCLMLHGLGLSLVRQPTRIQQSLVPAVVMGAGSVAVEAALGNPKNLESCRGP